MAAKTTKTKSKKSKKSNPIDDLEKEINSDLANEFDFDDEGEEGMSAKTEVDYTGKSVTFLNDEGVNDVGIVKGLNTDEDAQDGEWKVLNGDDELFFMTPDEWELSDEDDDDDEFDIDLELEEAVAPKKTQRKSAAKKAAEKKAKKPVAKKPVAKKPAAKKPAAKSKPVAKKPAVKSKPKKATPPPELSRREMIRVDSISIPDVKVRGLDENTKEFKKFLADFKERGQRDAIEVHDLDSQKPILIDGLRRYTAAKILGVEYLEAKLPVEGCEDAEDRLWQGLKANEFREQMNWVDLATVFSRLHKSKKYTQKVIADSYGISNKRISQMISSLKLGEPVLEHARSEQYPESVFVEMIGASEEVVDKIAEKMTSNKKITTKDVRNLKDLDKKNSGADSTSNSGPTTPTKTLTTRQVANSEIGDQIKIKVKQDSIHVTFSIDHDKKTFSRFDMMKEIKGLFDEAFGNDSNSVDTFKGLNKVVGGLRAELLKDN